MNVDTSSQLEVLLEIEDSRLEIISDTDNILEDIKSKVGDIVGASSPTLLLGTASRGT